MHPQVRWVFRSQLLVTLAAGLLAGVLVGLDAAASAVLGGVIAMASGLAYVWRAMRPVDAAVARKAFQAQVLAEGYKFAVTLVLFVLVFVTYAQLAALALFLGYAAAAGVYWMALLRQ